MTDVGALMTRSTEVSFQASKLRAGPTRAAPAPFRPVSDRPLATFLVTVLDSVEEFLLKLLIMHRLLRRASTISASAAAVRMFLAGRRRLVGGLKDGWPRI